MPVPGGASGWGRTARAAGEPAAAAACDREAARRTAAVVLALDETDDRVGVGGPAGVSGEPDRAVEELVKLEVRAALAWLGGPGHRVARDRGAHGPVVPGLGAGLAEQAPASERPGVGDGVAGDRQVHRRVALAVEEADPGVVLVLEEAVVGDGQRLGDRALREDADVVALRTGVGRRGGADRVAVDRAGQRPAGAVLVDGDAGEDRVLNVVVAGGERGVGVAERADHHAAAGHPG